MNKNARKTIIIIFICTAFLLAILIPYAISILKDKEIDQTIRDSLTDSNFIKLPNGYTQYELAGDDKGQIVVLLSGFSVPYYCWDFIFEDLIANGYRVLRYNHYGRGFSDHLNKSYTPEIFDSQLYELITALKLPTPVDLIGLSMGGAITVYFTNHHPELVDKVALISPTGFPIPENFATKLVKVPILGDYIFSVFGDGILTSRNVTNLMNLENHPEFQAQFIQGLSYRGRSAALLSTLRHMPFTHMETEYQNFPKNKLNVLLIWGEDDAVIPFEHHLLVQKAIPQTEFHAIPQTGHVSPYENPGAILSYLYPFLSN